MGPSGDGWTYRENRRAFNDFPIMPRRLQGVTRHRPAHDAARSQTGAAGVHVPDRRAGQLPRQGELPNAAGTGMAGTLFVASGASNRPMEEIAKATTGPKWFQIYMNRDMELNRWLVQRAKAADFSAIVLTADALGPGQSDDYIKLGRPRAAGSHRRQSRSGARRPRQFQRPEARLEFQRHHVPARGVRSAGAGEGRGAAGRYPPKPRGGRCRNLGLQSRRPSDGRRTGLDQHVARRGRRGRRPRAGRARQRHPPRHRYVPGAGARRDGGRHRPAGACGA